MKPGYKNKKKISKRKRSQAQTESKALGESETIEDVACPMEVDEDTSKSLNRREKKKKELLAVKKEKANLMKKTSYKSRKLAARGVEGATNLACNKIGAAVLKLTQPSRRTGPEKGFVLADEMMNQAP